MLFVKKINWQNLPSISSPITAAELTRMENGIEEGARDATETQAGNVELATAGEMTNGTDLTRVPSVKRVVDYIEATIVSIGGVTTEYVLTAISAPFSLIATAIGMVPLTIKAMTGQTANLIEVKNDSDVVIASIDKSGQVTGGGSYSATAMLKALCRAANIAGVRVRQASSQTAPYFVGEDVTGVTKVSISADGTVNAANIGTVPGTSVRYSQNMVLDAAEAVPAATLAGTIIFRRPA